ncbi:MAG: membrane lipoprotein lipid attachment site-containing protein, partial [Prevotella sp.]|nr:membrane lipoprotein lipid attachment site-containing protein [Prevotella sp.]
MKKYIFYFLAILCLTACTLEKQQAEELGKEATIFPDYSGTLLPVNLSPPVFALTDSTESLDNQQAVFTAGEKTVVVANEGDDGFCLSENDWKILKEHSQTISVTIQGKRKGKWVEYEPFDIHISPDSIDNTLVYRLIEPGYEVWNE